MRIGQFAKYKGYIGSIEYEPDDDSYHGLLVNTDDFVNYVGDSIVDLHKQYHDAVDDYIALSKEIKKLVGPSRVSPMES